MAAAVVCGKRSYSIFDDPLHLSKRIRRSSSPRFSPSLVDPLHFSKRTSSPRFSPSLVDPLHLSKRIRRSSSPRFVTTTSLASEMDQQFPEKALEESGNDLDSTTRSLNDLRLATRENIVDFSATNGIEANVQLSTEGMMSSNGSGGAASQNTSINAHAGAEATQNLHKESAMLKEQVEVLLQENNNLKRENNILKRGVVAIQHARQKEYEQYQERQKEYDDKKNQELQQLKKQLRMHKVNEYAMAMHLNQALQSSSISGSFHPDVF